MLLTRREVCSKRINSANWSSTEWIRVSVKNISCSVRGVRDAVKGAEGVISIVKTTAAEH